MSHIKIGLSMLYCLSESFSKMVQRLNTVETSYVEVVDDGLHALNKTRVSMLKDIGSSRGLVFTVHAPFADMNIASPSKPMLNATLKRLKQSIHYACVLNAGLWVFHPGNRTGISMFYPDKDWQQNIKSVAELSKIAEDCGVNIAMENLPEKYGFIMKNAEDFIKFYQESSLGTGIALDVGHANLEGQIEPFLKKLPDKIVHIHISDNMGENDQHLGLGYGKISWQQFAKTLKTIGYDKTVMVESVEHVEESLQKLKQILS